jgi:hypothetical protein
MMRLVAAAVAALAVIAFAAVAGRAQAAPSGPLTAAEDTAAGTLDVSFAVNKFVVRGKKLVAVGNVIGTFTSAEGTEVVRQPFASPVRKVTIRRIQSAQQVARICDILSLDLAGLRLELLGLIIELDRVVLTIKADSNGGILGSLLCGLAGPGRGGLSTLATPKNAQKLTTVARQSGLAAGPGFTVPVQAPTQLPPVPPGVCTVLDLVLGPLDLNLLGLMIHLDRVHLRITADPTRGILGSLLCSLAGGPPGLPAP